MEVRPTVNQPKTNKVVNLAVKSLFAGAIASETQRLMMPVETRAALKNARLGADKFVLASTKAAVKTGKNLGKSFDLDAVAEKAKNMYPGIVKTANKATKKLNKTFVGVTLGVAAASTLVSLVAKAKVDKAE